MTVKFNWKQALVITIDVVVAGYLLMAMMSFNKPMAHHDVCTQVKIDNGENVAQGFLNVDEIKQMLQRQQLYPLAQKMDAIDVRAIEESLCRSPYNTEAQCYKTHDGHVCISLSQRLCTVRRYGDNANRHSASLLSVGALLATRCDSFKVTVSANSDGWLYFSIALFNSSQ